MYSQIGQKKVEFGSHKMVTISMVIMRILLKIKEIKQLIQGCKNDRIGCRGRYIYSPTMNKSHRKFHLEIKMTE